MNEDKRFKRLYATAQEFRGSTYIRKFVAPSFQLMIRAEAGAFGGTTEAFWPEKGAIVRMQTSLGECACVTCGKTRPWRGGATAPGGGMHTGHFIGGRSNSIIFEETNVAPQCSHCNLYMKGNQETYSTWMLYVHGKDQIDHLRWLRDQSVSYSREELVRMRMGFMDRLKAAKKIMGVK